MRRYLDSIEAGIVVNCRLAVEEAVDDGVRSHPRVLLPDGQVGYGIQPGRLDDCLRVAVATAIQVPPEQLPDPRLDDRLAAGEDPAEISRSVWAQLQEWLKNRGLRLVFHETVPVARERWVGVCAVPEALVAKLAVFATTNALVGRRVGEFGDHSLVMSYDRVLFDPAGSAQAPPGFRIRRYDLSDVTYGISFDRFERKD